MRTALASAANREAGCAVFTDQSGIYGFRSMVRTAHPSIDLN